MFVIYGLKMLCYCVRCVKLEDLTALKNVNAQGTKQILNMDLRCLNANNYSQYYVILLYLVVTRNTIDI